MNLRDWARRWLGEEASSSGLGRIPFLHAGAPFARADQAWEIPLKIPRYAPNIRMTTEWIPPVVCVRSDAQPGATCGRPEEAHIGIAMS